MDYCANMQGVSEHFMVEVFHGFVRFQMSDFFETEVRDLNVDVGFQKCLNLTAEFERQILNIFEGEVHLSVKMRLDDRNRTSDSK